MAVIAALVYAGHERLRYLVTSSGGAGGSVTITSTGAATPDLITDSVAGPIKNIANVFTNGYGLLPAGALTQAQARALWLSDDPTNVVSTGSQKPPCAQATITARDASTPGLFVVDANASANHATIVVTAANDGTAYLDIYMPGAIGA
jgi:hypothetical protein